jgi:hypothetical protein
MLQELPRTHRAGRGARRGEGARRAADHVRVGEVGADEVVVAGVDGRAQLLAHLMGARIAAPMLTKLKCYSAGLLTFYVGEI